MPLSLKDGLCWSWNPRSSLLYVNSNSMLFYSILNIMRVPRKLAFLTKNIIATELEKTFERLGYVLIYTYIA